MNNFVPIALKFIWSYQDAADDKLLITDYDIKLIIVIT